MTHAVKVHFENAGHIMAKLNGTRDEIKAYYEGKIFNLGVTSDLKAKVERVEFLEQEGQ